MAMNLGNSAGSGEPEVLNEINTTPLIDVMLVLLIMLILTIPVQLHAVDLKLPQGTPPTASTPPVVVRIDVQPGDAVIWNGEHLADSEALATHLREVAAQPVQPELHIRPQADVDYGAVARVLATAQRLGATKLGIVGDEQFLR